MIPSGASEGQGEAVLSAWLSGSRAFGYFYMKVSGVMLNNIQFVAARDQFISAEDSGQFTLLLV